MPAIDGRALDRITLNFDTAMKHRLRRPLEFSGHSSEEQDTAHYQLKQGRFRRKDIVDARAKNGKSPGKSLRESLPLQKQLRQLTHQLLAAQDHEREKISHELQDELAQTLSGVNARLL